MRTDPLLLAGELEALATELRSSGDVLWQRSSDWVRVETRSGDGERGGGLGDAVSEDAIGEKIADRQASRYHSELLNLLPRLFADARRARAVVEIVCPSQPRKLKGQELTVAQAAAEGWCASCHRDDGFIEPVHPQGRYKDWCRFCGEWKAAHGGELPPLGVVRWRHRHPGKHVPLAIVEQGART